MDKLSLQELHAVGLVTIESSCSCSTQQQKLGPKETQSIIMWVSATPYGFAIYLHSYQVTTE